MCSSKKYKLKLCAKITIRGVLLLNVQKNCIAGKDRDSYYATNVKDGRRIKNNSDKISILSICNNIVKKTTFETATTNHNSSTTIPIKATDTHPMNSLINNISNNNNNKTGSPKQTRTAAKQTRVSLINFSQILTAYGPVSPPCLCLERGLPLCVPLPQRIELPPQPVAQQEAVGVLEELASGDGGQANLRRKVNKKSCLQVYDGKKTFCPSESPTSGFWTFY